LWNSICDLINTPELSQGMGKVPKIENQLQILTSVEQSLKQSSTGQFNLLTQHYQVRNMEGNQATVTQTAHHLEMKRNQLVAAAFVERKPLTAMVDEHLRELESAFIRCGTTPLYEIPPCATLDDGIWTIDEKSALLPWEQFKHHVAFMRAVDKKLEREFDAAKSRPVMQQLQLGPGVTQQLKAVFFTEKGALKLEVQDSLVDDGSQFYNICFNNTNKGTAKDHRFQLPVKSHPTSGVPVPIRMAVEKILINEGIIDPTVERVNGLAMLVGGTQDQIVHHDLPRVLLCYRKKNGKEVTGWELHRKGYNASMKSGHAPCSVLLPMGNDHLLLGVQKDQQLMLSHDQSGRNLQHVSGKHCKVISGVPTDTFEVVREEDHYVVLKIKGGCMFTGDFKHCGVCNVENNSRQSKLLNKLMTQMAERDNGQSPKKVMKQITSLLSRTKNLDGLCRLHFTTQPIAPTFMYPPDKVGFSDCT